MYICLKYISQWLYWDWTEQTAWLMQWEFVGNVWNEFLSVNQFRLVIFNQLFNLLICLFHCLQGSGWLRPACISFINRKYSWLIFCEGSKLVLCVLHYVCAQMSLAQMSLLLEVITSSNVTCSIVVLAQKSLPLLSLHFCRLLFCHLLKCRIIEYGMPLFILYLFISLK